MKQPTPEMEPISEETKAKLRAISKRIHELEAQIDELKEEAYGLVPKHTFEECKAMECEHTFRNRWDCHHYCVRRKSMKGCFHDYYTKKQKVFKPKVDYPTLGWKSVVTEGNSFVKKVAKETEKALFLDDSWKTMLLKSTIKHAEDCIFIQDRSGTTYICADDPSTIEMQKTLLKVMQKEWCENMAGKVHMALDGPAITDIFGD